MQEEVKKENKQDDSKENKEFMKARWKETLGEAFRNKDQPIVVLNAVGYDSIHNLLGSMTGVQAKRMMAAFIEFVEELKDEVISDSPKLPRIE